MVAVGISNLVVSGAPGGPMIVTIWGVFTSTISSLFVLRFASMHETHVRLLRRVFGDRLTSGDRPIADPWGLEIGA